MLDKMSDFNYRRDIDAYYSNKKLDVTPDIEQNDYVYSMEILTRHQDFYLLGCDEKGYQKKCRLDDTQPGLYVWVQSYSDLYCMVRLKYLDLTRNTTDCGCSLTATGVSLLDRVLNTNMVHRDDEEPNWFMYKIPTKTYDDSRNLYFLLTESVAFSSYIKCTALWSLEMFLMLEKFCKTKSWQNVTMYGVYLNSLMENCFTKATPIIDFVAFDIETGSHDRNRIPMGELKTDVLLSTSIVKITAYEKTLYSISNCTEHASKINCKLLIENGRETKYPYNLTRKVMVMEKEIDVLRETLKLLFTPKRFSFILGYNSKGYDISFLLKRSVYLGLVEADDFYVQSGIITYSLFTTHIDIYLIIEKYYKGELSSFSLKNVVSECINHASKVDLDAVELRFIYMHMLDNGIPENGEFPQWNTTLAEMAHYNDVDSILVMRLWYELGYDQFLIDVSRNYIISMIRLGQSEISEYVSTKYQLTAFVNNILACTHHENVLVDADNMVIKYDNGKLVASVDNNGKEGSYGGGYNYCESKKIHYDVDMCDYVAYYPYLIEGFNISPETCCLVSVKCALTFLNEDNCKHIEMYRFNAHKSSPDPIANKIEARLLLNGIIDNVSVVLLKDLTCMDLNSKIILLDRKHIGILTRVMKHQNNVRDIAKSNKKTIQAISEKINEALSIKLMEEEMGETFTSINQTNNAADDDDGFSDDDEDEAKVDAADDDGFSDDDEAEASTESNKDETCINYGMSDVDLVSFRIKMPTPGEILKMDIDMLNVWQNKLSAEFSRLNSMYRSLKIENSGMYGLLGSAFGGVKAKHVAGIVTCFGRKYIIETAKIAQKNNYMVVLIDTDSVFMRALDDPNRKNNIPATMARINPKLELNTKRYPCVFTITKKVYIASYDGCFSRGITKNGPHIWADTLYDAFKTYILNKEQITTKDLIAKLQLIYRNLYNLLGINKKLVLCKMNIKDISEYKCGATPTKMLMERIVNENPNYVFDRKLIYFHLMRNNAKEVVFEIDYKLNDTHLSQLNLFKFFSKIHTPLYHIFSMAMTDYLREKKNIHYSITKKAFFEYLYVAFIKARLELMYPDDATDREKGKLNKTNVRRIAKTSRKLSTVKYVKILMMIHELIN